MKHPAFLALSSLVLLCTGCDRHLHVTEQMSWRCAPDYRDAKYPRAEPVMFTYVKNPGETILQSGAGLCEELTSSGKPTVDVDFEVWGNALTGLHGYNIQRVDGKPLHDLGGPGFARSIGQSGAHPFNGLFK